MPTIIGLFQRYEDADEAVCQLQRLGIGANQLHLAARKRVLQRRLEIPGATDETPVVGLGRMLLHSHVLRFVELGPVSVMGPGLEAWSMKTSSGQELLGSSLVEALMACGLTHAAAHEYAGGVARGGIVLTVRTDETNDAPIRQIMMGAGVVRSASIATQPVEARPRIPAPAAPDAFPLPQPVSIAA